MTIQNPISGRRIIDGKKIASELKSEIAAEVTRLKTQLKVTPSLHVILVGENHASKIYVNNKQKACAEVGISSTVHRIVKDTTEGEVLNLIQSLNADPEVHGILLQLPVPSHINKNNLLRAIHPLKDVDGLNPFNLGNLFSGHLFSGDYSNDSSGDFLVPCTPQGCLRLIESTGISLPRKSAVVVGRSVLVGRPMQALLTNADVTVTLAHSKTKNLQELCQGADIVVAASGVPGLIRPDFIKNGAVVIDVGITRLEDNAIVGDVAFDLLQNIDVYVTPVPGGVGPMTVACLLLNTIKAMKMQKRQIKNY